MYRFSSQPDEWTDQELQWILPYSDSKVLGLGEAVRTSEGLYAEKIRLFKYLIEHHNYRAIAFETPWGRALSASRFVQAGEGTVQNALKGLFRLWSSKSIEKFLLWLRQWNIDHPNDPVRFFGNDAQQPERDLNCILNSELVTASEKEQIKSLFTTMFGSGVFLYGYPQTDYFKNLFKVGFAENQDQTAAITDLLNNFTFEKSTYEYAARRSLLAYVVDTSKNVYGTTQNIVKLRGEAYAQRDECMSDLTLHFAGNDKTLLWAHNWHILRPSEQLDDGCYYQGQFLKKSLGEKYMAIALTAGHMAINWPWRPDHWQDPMLPQHSLEKAVADHCPNQSVFLTSKGDLDCSNYSFEFNFEHDKDISARFDGLLVLADSGPIEYAIGID